MGSIFGGSSNKTTQNTVAEPWKPIQPYLKQGAGDVMGAYNQGALNVQPYQGDRVAPQSGLTGGAYNYLSQMAQQGDQFTNMAGGALSNLFNPQTQSGLTQAGQAGIAQTAMDYNPVRDAGMYAYGQAAAGPEAGLGGLNTAQQMLSQYGNNAQAYAQLNDVKQNILADVIPAVSSRFANSGMLDSSLAADTISRSAAQAVAPIEYGAWENAQNRGLNAFSQAAGMEQGAYEGARNRQMGAISAMPSTMQARYLDPMMAMQAGQATDQFNSGERNRALSAVGAAGDMSRSQYLLPTMMQQMGGTQDAYNQRLTDAASGQYYEGQNAPYNELQRLSSLLLGYGGMGGTESKSATQPGSPLMSTGGDIAQTIALAMMMK